MLLFAFVLGLGIAFNNQIFDLLKQFVHFVSEIRFVYFFLLIWIRFKVICKKYILLLYKFIPFESDCETVRNGSSGIFDKYKISFTGMIIFYQRLETLSLALIRHSNACIIEYCRHDAALKIYRGLPEEIQQYCRLSLEKIAVLAYCRTKTARLDGLFVKFMEAIVNRRVVSINYRQTGDPEYRTVEFEPYHLRYCGSAWHVIGKSSNNNSVIGINFCQIKNMYLLGRFFFSDDFDIDEYLGNAWSMEPQGRLYHVKLKFEPKIAQEVAQIQWHKTQTVSYQPDGSVIMEFCVDGLDEIKWWILSYSDLVQVIEPPALREIIVSIAESMVKLNQ